jgi:hypothetical protein
MHITTKIIAAGFLAGVLLGGAAHATNSTSCQHSQQQNQYHCTMPDGSTKTYNSASADAEAVAIAAQAQWQAQQQQQGQIAEGGDAEASATGGNANNSNAITISNPKQPRITGNIGIGINATILSGVQTNNDLGVASALMNAGQTCDGLKVLYNTPSAKRAGLGKPNCGGSSSITGQGFTACSFSKETGKLTVAPRTQYAAEACAITIGMDPSRVKL